MAILSVGCPVHCSMPIRPAYARVFRLPNARRLLMLPVLFFLFSIAGLTAHAQEGILPGEPDPNTSPHHDHQDPNGREETALVDDRAPCKKGLQRVQKMKCGTKEQAKKECDNYSPVLECRKRPKILHCKKPQMPIPAYRCE